MYAVVQTGGRQFLVRPEETLRIPPIEAEVGSTVELDRVLFLGDAEEPAVGNPLVEGARVVAEVTGQGREEKILVFHKKRRKRFQRKRGHRQPFTEIRVKEIRSA